MASTRVRGVSGTGTSATPNAVLAGTPTNGNLIVAYVKAISSAVITVANGFALLTLGTSGTVSGVLLWKIASGESTTIQPASLDGSKAWGCFVSEWTNPNGWPANPVSIENAQAVAATASYTTNTLSPSADVDNVIAAGYGCINASRTWSAEAFITSNIGAVTEEGDGAGSTMAVAAISAVTGNYQGSATCSASTAGFDSIAIFKPNAAGGAAANPHRLALLGVG